jgi:hypothetical protein
MLRTVPRCFASKGVVGAFSEDNECGEEDEMIRRRWHTFGKGSGNSRKAVYDIEKGRMIDAKRLAIGRSVE